MLYLWWSLCTLHLLVCQVRVTVEDVLLVELMYLVFTRMVELMYLVFTRMPGESYGRGCTSGRACVPCIHSHGRACVPCIHSHGRAYVPCIHSHGRAYVPCIHSHGRASLCTLYSLAS